MAAAFLTNFLFWSGMSIGAVALVAFVDVSGGAWLGPMRVTAFRFVRFLPISFLLLLLLLWRRADVYEWARTPSDSVWLAPAFVVIRDAIAMAAVYLSAFAYTRRSTGSAAVTFLIVYAVGFSILAIDLIMSLQPRWTSTLFPAYVLTGNVCAGAIAVATWTAWSSPSAMASIVRTTVRDAANLLVGLALFWLYLFWSQFLVIWYGNVTSEVGFVMARVGTAHPIGWSVLALCWAAPAIVFVPQWGKRIGPIRVVGILALVGCWLERWLLVSPELPSASIVSAIAITFAFGALFGVSVAWRRAGPAYEPASRQ